MNILLGIKKYIYLIVSIFTTVFLGWVYFLKKDNESKEDEIEDLKYEAKVQEKVHKEEQKIAEFKGAVEANDGVLDEKIKKAQEAYDKVKDKSNENNSIDDNFTFV